MNYCEMLKENPKLMEEWDCEKNGDLRLEDCINSPRRFVWWKCASGHSWQARISDRLKGFGCPYDCSRRKYDFKSFASVRPDLVSEWDYKGNDYLSPYEVSAYSRIKIKWHCKQDHSWKATISSRTQGSGCIMCLKERLENGQ